MPPKVMATDTDIEMDCATDAVVVFEVTALRSALVRKRLTQDRSNYLDDHLSLRGLGSVPHRPDRIIIGRVNHEELARIALKGFGKAFQTILGVGYASPLSD
jgi:hypothetical protein